jgi:hypothetical protein
MERYGAEAIQFFQGLSGPCVAALVTVDGRRLGWAIDEGDGLEPKWKGKRPDMRRLLKDINLAIESCVLHALGKHGTVVPDGAGCWTVEKGPPTTTGKPPVPYSGDPLIMSEAAAAPG